MVFSGSSPDNSLIELIELRNHPYFVASQFHPEFKSRPEKPHPLFLGFMRAVAGLPVSGSENVQANLNVKEQRP